MKYFLTLFACLLLIYTSSLMAENHEEQNNGKYLSVVKEYVQTMIDKGRDVYGSVNSPLFASVLNRKTMLIDSSLQNIKIPGVRARDRSITGANMIHDKYLLQILYDLSEITGESKYASESNKALKYFFTNCQSSTTGFMCWGEHLYWDFYLDDCGYAPNYDFHEATKWPFWDQSYKLGPDACWRFALGEWDHQINDQTTGDFSRHARYTRHETFSGFDFPRYAGQMIERWADAYQRPENSSRARKEDLKTAIKVLYNRMVENMRLSKSGYLIAGRSHKGDHINLVWLTNNLELARCLQEAAPSMDTVLGNHMLALALKQDEGFLKAPHKLDSAGGGFAVTLHAETGLPRSRSMNKPYTTTWSSGYGYGTHAKVANTCYERFENLRNKYPEMAQRYQDLMIKASDRYLVSAPDTASLLKPKEFADAIELMLNCHDLTGQTKYLDRAIFFAELGIDLFLDETSALPKATSKNGHYESITGGPVFMYQLLRLHQKK